LLLLYILMSNMATTAILFHSLLHICCLIQYGLEQLFESDHGKAQAAIEFRPSVGNAGISRISRARGSDAVVRVWLHSRQPQDGGTKYVAECLVRLNGTFGRQGYCWQPGHVTKATACNLFSVTSGPWKPMRARCDY
jgi:hypothetical protein